jgi:hypothetical protein
MTLRFFLRQIVAAVAESVAKETGLVLPDGFAPRIDYTPDLKFGHYATPRSDGARKSVSTKPAGDS